MNVIAWLVAIGRSLRGGRRSRNISGDSAAETIAELTPGDFFDGEFLKQLERLRLVAKRMHWAGAKGEHPSLRKGHSLEFSDYRRYQRGDDLRYVDWNVYRRLERLLLKVFVADQEMNVYLLIDASRSMAEGTPAKIHYARRIAAAVGYIGLKNLDRVGGATFSSGIVSTLSPGRGRKQILRLFRFFGSVPCGGETNLLPVAKSFAKLFPLPGLVVFVSDLLDPAGPRHALEELARQRHQLLVIHLLAPEELEPEAAGEVLLHEVEGGRERSCFIDSDLAQRYRQRLRDLCTDIETFCAQRAIDYVRITTQTPFDQFLLSMLRQVSSVA